MGAVHWVASLVVLGSLLVGCTTPAPSSGGVEPRASGATEPLAPRVPQRITAAIGSDPGSLIMRVNPSSAGLPELSVLQTLVGSGLSARDDDGVPQPHLAAEVPSLENGLWKVFPDGRMETTWRLRPNATWHDGTPFTAADVVFTGQVDQDKDLDIIINPAYESIESVAAPDPHTVVVRWKRPYIEPDRVFDLPPFPRHLLEPTYTGSKPTFGQLGYWTQEYVGTGPFRVREFVGGSHMLLAANDRYALGRPKLDEIEVKFIRDSNTLSANILAGTVDLTLGRTLALEDAVQIQAQWRDGWMDATLSSWVLLWPQLLNANPPVIQDVRFRRALLHAIDRQQMADTLLGGKVPPAHTFLSPNDPSYRTLEPRIVRYDYDPRRAMQMIEDLGFRKAPDGVYRDPAGPRLGVEVRSSGGRALNEQTTLAVADYWQRIGIAAESMVIPQQRLRDREYVQTFPGFHAANQPNDPNSLNRYRSSQSPLPENNYVGNNNPRYMSPEYDALVDRLFATIPLGERSAILGDIIHHYSDQLVVLGLFYNAQPIMIANRLQNVNPQRGEGASQTWNAVLWEVKS